VLTRLQLRLMDFDGPQYLIAQYTGISASKLSEYKLGKAPIPARHLITMARLLRVRPEDIVGWADEDECPELDLEVDEAVM
jgi:transcriptional regulator with XRE-family HTH domain